MALLGFLCRWKNSHPRSQILFLEPRNIWTDEIKARCDRCNRILYIKLGPDCRYDRIIREEK